MYVIRPSSLRYPNSLHSSVSEAETVTHELMNLGASAERPGLCFSIRGTSFVDHENGTGITVAQKILFVAECHCIDVTRRRMVKSYTVGCFNKTNSEVGAGTCCPTYLGTYLWAPARKFMLCLKIKL